MKKLALTMTLLVCANVTFAQKVSLSVYANTNLYHYTGEGTTAETFMMQGYTDEANYTNNPYGQKQALGFGVGLQLQWVSTAGFILGTKAGYEQVNSKVNITSVYPNMTFLQYYSVYYVGKNATGRTYLRNSTINLGPYVGYRFKLKSASIDVLPTMDIGIALNSKEDGEATTSDQRYTTNFKRAKPPVDLRPGLALAFGLNRYAITGSYAHGSTLLTENYVGSNASAKVKSEIWRLGLSYRIF